jgi:hypothetical protein
MPPPPPESAAAQLAASSRQKYALGLRRLEEGDPTLALLSIHGAVEDGLRAYLARQGQDGIDGWRDIIERLRADAAMPLDDDIAAQLRRANALRNRVAHGEHGIVERDVIADYQRLAARLLPAYGVTLGKQAPKPQPGPREQARPAKAKVAAPKKRPRAAPQQAPAGGFNPLIPIGAVALVLLIGLLTTLAQNSPRTTVVDTPLQPTGAPALLAGDDAAIAATLTAAPVSASPVPVEPAFVQLVAGAYAAVSAEGDQLSLRAEPGLNGVLLASLAAGTSVQILAGPHEADGLRWWRVRFGDLEGWCAEQYLVIQAGP